jgi:hypothetical protein
MALKHTVMERLAFIKYLYNTAVDQSRKPQPLCSASILTFHDSVELLLHLASEHLDAGKKDVSFVAYWDILNGKLRKSSDSQSQLSQKESMRRLDKARGELKHFGIRPSKSDVEDFRVSVTSFFVENIPVIFGIEFPSVSLVDIVEYEDARDNLREAEAMLTESKIEDALSKSAIAFEQLIGHQVQKHRELGHSHFFFGKPFYSATLFINSVKRSKYIVTDAVKTSMPEKLRNFLTIL